MLMEKNYTLMDINFSMFACVSYVMCHDRWINVLSRALLLMNFYNMKKVFLHFFKTILTEAEGRIFQ